MLCLDTFSRVLPNRLLYSVTTKEMQHTPMINTAMITNGRGGWELSNCGERRDTKSSPGPKNPVAMIVTTAVHQETDTVMPSVFSRIASGAYCPPAPTKAGTYSFTVKIVDTKTKTKPPVQHVATATFTITVS